MSVRDLRTAGRSAGVEAVRRAKVLELIGVGKQYGTGPVVHALTGVDLALERGDWLAITGPSGSGKSTLLNVIGCLDRPTSGVYLFDGTDTTRLTEDERAGLRSQRIGFVFQSFHLMAYRTVLENVMLADVYCGGSRTTRADRAWAALDAVGIGDRADALPTRLSGGERQRVAIARAILNRPRLLLCDEPTGNLDSGTTTTILQLLADLSRLGLTIIVITHDAGVAAWSERTVHLRDGQVVDGQTAGAQDGVGHGGDRRRERVRGGR